MNKLLVAAVLLIMLGQNPEAQAQLRWRISVKFFLDADGNLPDAGGGLGSWAEVSNHVNAANALLHGSHRGYELSLTEIVNLSGLSEWFEAFATQANKNILEGRALAHPALYAYRDNAVNVYINNQSGGTCSFPGRGNIVLIGAVQVPTGISTNSFPTLLHEFGHYLNLCHTMGCFCGGCGENASCDAGGGDDGIADTVLDSACWTNRNQISAANFGQPYANLSASQQRSIDFTFLNVMSYHSETLLLDGLLTSDQYDMMTDTSNGPRFNITNGRTHFVDGSVGSGGNGSAGAPFHTVAVGLTNAATSDIVLIRAGRYNEPGLYNRRATLRATRGNAIIGLP